MPKGKEKIYRQGLADPRSGPDRVMDLANRALTGNFRSPARAWDDNPKQQRKAVAASAAARGKAKAKAKKKKK